MMHQQYGRSHRNTITAINIAIIWSSQKVSDNIKEVTHNQDRKYELIGGADASIVWAGA